jgi:hypothetical protein
VRNQCWVVVLFALFVGSLFAEPLPKFKFLDDTVHLVLYYPPYAAQANVIVNMCNQQWGVKTQMVATSQIVSRAGDTANETDTTKSIQVINPLSHEAGFWSAHWERMRVNGAVLLNDPRGIAWGLGGKVGGKVEYVTILGNKLEIPPSIGIPVSFGDETVITGSDFYYGLSYNNGTPNSYIPQASVTRLPVTLMSNVVGEQLINFTINASKSTRSVYHISLANAAGANLVGAGNSLSLEFPKEVEGINKAYPFYQLLTGASANLAGNVNTEFKVFFTELKKDENATKTTNDDYALADTTRFPYIIQRNARTSVDASLTGSYVLLDGAIVKEAFEAQDYGKESLAVYDSIYKPASVQGNVIIKTAALSGGELVVTLKEGSFDPTGSTPATFTVGNNSYYAVFASGTLHAITAYSSTAAGNTFTMSSSVGDKVYNKLADYNGKEFALMNATTLKNYLVSLGVDKVNYLDNPGFIMDEKGELLVENAGSILNLSQSATDMVNKLANWNTYFQAGKSDWYDTPYGGFFHKALLLDNATTSLWSYFEEHVLAEIINYVDNTGSEQISLSNGFNITKAFASNPGGSGNLRRDETETHQLFAQNGTILGVGNWNKYSLPMYGIVNLNGGNVSTSIGGFAVDYFNATPYSANLSFLMGAQDYGYDLVYTTASVVTGFFNIPEFMLACKEVGGLRRGLMGYIGSMFPAIDGASEGVWSDGRLSPVNRNNSQLLDRHMLMRETFRQYATGGQPRIGSIYREGINGYLQALKNYSTTGETLEQIAESKLSEIERWGGMGIAAQPLPAHRHYSKVSAFPGDVPAPIISMTSASLRSDTYDRYSVPVLEVPHGNSASYGEPDRTMSVNVQISLDNIADITQNGTTISRGFNSYNPNTKFKVTLVSIPLSLGGTGGHRISELDFVTPTVASAESSLVQEFTIADFVAGNVQFKFFGNWSRVAGNLQRGPANYMVKVEAKEKDRTDLGLYAEQRTGSFTKEARLFFKVVNEFKVDSDVNILLVNNTDHDPYVQILPTRTGLVPFHPEPNTAIRFYEDALDNYQYTKGTASVGAGSTITEDNETVSAWKYRVVVGDKIRLFDQSTESLTPWLRVASVADTGEKRTLTVLDPTGALGTIANFASVNYVIQRTYSVGSASMASEVDFTDFSPTFSTNFVTLSVDNDQLQGAGSLGLGSTAGGNIVQIGDYFKFLDGRVFRKISNVAVTPGATTTTITLTLDTEYPYGTLLHYHSNTTFGGVARLTSPFSQNVTGSYAIYPPNSAGTGPRRLYQTWNVHNYDTSNYAGLGVHGDLTLSVLNNFSDSNGDTSGRRHKVVVVANDAGYSYPSWKEKGYLWRDRNLDGTAETEVVDGRAEYYISDADSQRYQSFLEQGGRLFTGGQYVSVDVDGPLFNLLGLSNTVDASATAVDRVNGDPISQDFNNNISIQVGNGEGSASTIDSESLNTSVEPKALIMTDGKAQETLYYTDSISAESEVAAIRVSGGSTTRPYAAVYAGFDFADMSFSGKKSEFSNATDSDGDQSGRNIFMKRSVDWLRDPSRTSVTERLAVDYVAEDADGSLKTLTLAAPYIVNDALHKNNSMLTGVGPNMDLTFSAKGGILYGSGNYKWTFSGGGNLIADPTAEQNTDFHQVIFRTGDSATAEYVVEVTSPDGGKITFTISTKIQPLNIFIPNVTGKVIDSSMIYSAGANVILRSYGGRGFNSFVYSISDSGDAFSDPNQLVNLGEGLLDYTLPSVSLTSEKSVVIQVQSGSATATVILKIYPPLKFSPISRSHVNGGTPVSFDVSGGKPTDATGQVVGYTYSSPDSLTLTSLGLGTSVSVSSTGVYGKDPRTPTTATVVATDKTFTAETASATVTIFGKPTLQLMTKIASGNTYSDVTSGVVMELPTGGNLLYFRTIGGNATTDLAVLATSGGVSDVAKAVYSYNEFTGGNTGGIKQDQSMKIYYFSGNHIAIDPGNRNGSMTLSLTSVGSVSTYALNFKSPLDVEVALANATLGAYAGATINLRAIDGTQTSVGNSMLKLKAPKVSGNAVWTLSDDSMGYFTDVTSYTALLASGTTIPVANRLLTVTTTSSAIAYFVAGTTLASGSIKVVDDVTKEQAYIAVATSNADPMAWDLATVKTTSEYVISRYGTITFTFSGGKGPYSVSLSGGLVGKLKVFGAKTYEADNAGLSMDGQKFVFSGIGTDSSGRIFVRDSNSSDLYSVGITIKNTSSVAVIEGAPTVATVPGSGGGGGCLLP